MIAYDIIVKHDKDQKLELKIVKPGDSDFKQTIFDRNLKRVRLAEGDRVKQRGTSNRGTVSAVVRDIEHINWANNCPMFVRVDFDDGTVMMCNPSQLKRSKT